jgi:hypothetical protein
VPFYPLLPGFFVLTALIILCYSLLQRPTEAAWAVVTLLAGVPFYWLGRSK